MINYFKTLLRNLKLKCSSRSIGLKTSLSLISEMKIGNRIMNRNKMITLFIFYSKIWSKDEDDLTNQV